MSRRPKPELHRLLDKETGLIPGMDRDLDHIRKHLPVVLARADAGWAGADGYPPQSMGGGGAPVYGGDPVGNLVAALADADRRVALGPDPVRTARNSAIFHLEQAARHLRNADSAVRDVIEPAPTDDEALLGSRPSSVPDCIVGNHLALPRPKRGLCGACYNAWDRADRPDIALWIPGRQAYLAEQELAEQPHRAAAVTTIRKVVDEACALCGHTPACGRATAWDGQRQVSLCHNDDHSCYHRWTVYGIRPREAA